MKSRVQRIIEKYTPIIDDRFQLYAREICGIYDLSKNDSADWREFNLIVNSFKVGYCKGYNAAKKQASENSTPPPIFANNQIQKGGGIMDNTSILQTLVSSLAMQAANDYIMGYIEHTDFEKARAASSAAVKYFWDNPAFGSGEKVELDTLIGATECEYQKQGFYYGFMYAVEMLKGGDIVPELLPPIEAPNLNKS